jgi:putative N6-adenine-specific DNA methylase
VLASELRALSLEVVREELAAVVVLADLAEQMRLCLRLRTAHRVLVPVCQFRAKRPGALYRQLMEIPWENHLGPDGYVRIHGVVRNEEIRDQRFAFLTVKDAVMDRLRSVYGRRPDSGPSDHGASVYLYWMDEEVTVSVDLAGRPLSKRGYRIQAGEAPLQESLAAAILLAGGWPMDCPLVNPMGGGGTLAIEAALLAQNRAPGLQREHFGLFDLKRFDQALWKKEVRAAEADIKPPEQVPALVCGDQDPAAVEIARANARRAGVEELIEFESCDFRQSAIPEGSAWVVMNPPYGLRLEEEDLAGLYRDMGQWLKGLNTGGQGLVITGNLALAKRFGLKLSQRHTLYNGPLECRLLGFELFKAGAPV